MPFDETGTEEEPLGFGIKFMIDAIDATSIDDNGMIITIDPGQKTCTLYSGSTKVARCFSFLDLKIILSPSGIIKIIF